MVLTAHSQRGESSQSLCYAGQMEPPSLPCPTGTNPSREPRKLGPIKLPMLGTSSKMECGCTSYIGAAPSHLEKIDKVQRRAEKLTSSEFQSLSIRREAACFNFICKILSGECVERLLKTCPDFKLEQISTNCNSSGFMGPNSTRSSRSEVQVTSMVGKLRNGATLNTFGRCFIAPGCRINSPTIRKLTLAIVGYES